MCNNQQPWNVSSTLSYGYAAAYISVSLKKKTSRKCLKSFFFKLG